jgi:CRP-like cAMP-binding protein
MSDNKEVIAELKPEGILSALLPADLEALKFYGTFGEYSVGEVVIKEGDKQDRLYLVISGKLEVSIASAGEQIKVGTMDPGQCFGEVSIFEPGPASASVKVIETSVMWSLDAISLQNFFEQVPLAGGQILLGISQLLSGRLRRANEILIENSLQPEISVQKFEPIRAGNLDDKGGLLDQFLKFKK